MISKTEIELSFWHLAWTAVAMNVWYVFSPIADQSELRLPVTNFLTGLADHYGSLSSVIK